MAQHHYHANCYAMLNDLLAVRPAVAPPALPVAVTVTLAAAVAGATITLPFVGLIAIPVEGTAT